MRVTKKDDIKGKLFFMLSVGSLCKLDSGEERLTFHSLALNGPPRE